MSQKQLFGGHERSSESPAPNEMKREMKRDFDNGLAEWPAESIDWTEALADAFDQESWSSLVGFLNRERETQEVFPPAADVFRAFQLTPLREIKFVVLGQDPYHGKGQAHGLSFSVRPGVKHPPSLANIFKELHTDIGIVTPQSGDLTPWAKQGGLMLNTVLTVRPADANSHRKQGWEKFTDAVIETVSDRCQHVAFVLWGTPARKKSKLIDTSKHLIVESAHPSPLSSYRGFFGSKPFSKINEYRGAHGLAAIDWTLQ